MLEEVTKINANKEIFVYLGEKTTASKVTLAVDKSAQARTR